VSAALVTQLVKRMRRIVLSSVASLDCTAFCNIINGKISAGGGGGEGNIQMVVVIFFSLSL